MHIINFLVNKQMCENTTLYSSNSCTRSISSICDEVSVSFPALYLSIDKFQVNDRFLVRSNKSKQ